MLPQTQLTTCETGGGGQERTETPRLREQSGWSGAWPPCPPKDQPSAGSPGHSRRLPRPHQEPPAPRKATEPGLGATLPRGPSPAVCPWPRGCPSLGRRDERATWGPKGVGTGCWSPLPEFKPSLCRTHERRGRGRFPSLLSPSPSPGPTGLAAGPSQQGVLPPCLSLCGPARASASRSPPPCE